MGRTDVASSADLIARRLAAAGCRYAFGIPGGEVLAIMDALERAGIRVVLAKHENCAGFMGEGVHHRDLAPAILVATIGPGIANAVNVIANCFQDRVPMVALAPRARPCHEIRAAADAGGNAAQNNAAETPWDLFSLSLSLAELGVAIADGNVLNILLAGAAVVRRERGRDPRRRRRRRQRRTKQRRRNPLGSLQPFALPCRAWRRDRGR